MFFEDIPIFNQQEIESTRLIERALQGALSSQKCFLVQFK